MSRAAWKPTLHSELKRILAEHGVEAADLNATWQQVLDRLDSVLATRDLRAHELKEELRALQSEQKAAARTSRRSNGGTSSPSPSRGESQSLQQSKAWLQGMFNSIEEAVLLFDESGHLRSLNPAAEELFGAQHDELEGLHARELYADSSAYRIDDQDVRDRFDRDESFSEINLFKRRNGGSFSAQHTVSRLNDDDGEPRGLVCVMRDLTEQRRQNRIQRVVANISEAALELESLHELLALIHEQIGTLLDARNFFVSLYNPARGTYTLPYIVDQYDDFDTSAEFTLEGSVTDYVRRTGKPLLADASTMGELEASGEIGLVGTLANHWMGVPMRAKAGIIGVVVVQTYDPEFFYTEDHFHLMIRVGEQIGHAVERKRAEQSLRASEQRNRAILDAIPDLMFVMSSEGIYKDYNAPSGDSLAVQPEVFLGKQVAEVMPAELAERTMKHLQTALATGEMQVFEYSLSVFDELRWFEARMVPSDRDEVLTVVRDITQQVRADEERKSLEAQMRHAQKLESLGVLAGGIAHDFNNLLVGMLGNAELALTTLTEDDREHGLIQRIQTSAMRAADLTRQMLAYSGKGSFLIEPLELKTVVADMAKLLDVSIPKDVVVEQDFEDEVPSIEGDVTQIRQVVMNLITNASEAIGDRPGRITIRTGITEIDEDNIRGLVLDHEIDPGHYVFLEIEDTGSGMDAETMTRMFDPFFTTKFTGRGLGLAAVLGIVRSHRGALSVSSRTGEGTVVRVYFPPGGKVVPPGSAPVVPTHGSEETRTVMVVDDDETVRDVATMMLSHHGYKVIEAVDGLEAVEIYNREAENIHLILLDMTMPRMDGAEAFRRMRRRNPAVTVLLTSGYNEQEVVSHFEDGLAGFIQKPYQLPELLAAVKGILEGDANVDDGGSSSG